MKRPLNLLSMCILLAPLGAAQSPLMRPDPATRAEMQIGMAVAVTKQQEAARKLTQDLEKRAFAERFRQMIDAAATFARAYNDGKSMVWPQSEATKLAKAMRKLQPLLHAPPAPEDRH